jgi:CRP-like cAMP-binding protein
MKEKLYGPGELVYKQGENDHRIFFIRKGQAEMIVEK